MMADTFRSPQARAERQRRYAELRDEGTDPGTAAGQVGITAHRAAGKYERTYQAGKGVTPPPAEDGDTPGVRLVAEPRGDWLEKRLGPVPECTTQEVRDRNMPLVHDTATELVGDYWKKPILPFIAARQCARFGRERKDVPGLDDLTAEEGRAELLQMCGLAQYAAKPRRGYVPKDREKGGGK